MSASNMDRVGSAVGPKRFIVPAVLVLALLGLGWFIASQMGQGSSAPKRQTVKIAVLPDTPPPPPPPPKEDKRPEPKPDETKPQPQEQKVVEAPPEPQQLKMEGAAGNGPSPFGAGNVSSDYKGEPLGSGGAPVVATAQDRSKFSFYAKSAQQLLRAELDRLLTKDVLSLGARLQIWVDASGRIERYEVQGVKDPDAEEKLKSALAVASKGFRLAPPVGLPQPMNMRLSVSPANG